MLYLLCDKRKWSSWNPCAMPSPPDCGGCACARLLRYSDPQVQVAAGADTFTVPFMVGIP